MRTGGRRITSVSQARLLNDDLLAALGGYGGEIVRNTRRHHESHRVRVYPVGSQPPATEDDLRREWHISRTSLSSAARTGRCMASRGTRTGGRSTTVAPSCGPTPSTRAEDQDTAAQGIVHEVNHILNGNTNPGTEAQLVSELRAYPVLGLAFARREEHPDSPEFRRSILHDQIGQGTYDPVYALYTNSKRANGALARRIDALIEGPWRSFPGNETNA